MYKRRGLTDKWLLRQVEARTLPKPIAKRRKTMFRADRARTFLGAARPSWVDQQHSPESLAATDFFDPRLVAGARRLRTSLPRITVKQIGLDASLTCAVSTQLWHHTYCGGGLCDLPTWTVPASPQLSRSRHCDTAPAHPIFGR